MEGLEEHGGVDVDHVGGGMREDVYDGCETTAPSYRHWMSPLGATAAPCTSRPAWRTRPDGDDGAGTPWPARA
jgi:hypothetical protein